MKYRILIIDDEKIDAMMISRAIKGMEIPSITKHASLGKEGLKMIEEEHFDCIITDFRMPDMDGIHLVKCLREKGIQTPIIFVTSHGDEHVATEVLRSGANDYMIKDAISTENLSLSLGNVIRNHEAEQQRQKMQEALHTSEARLREAQKLAKMGNLEIDVATKEVIWSEEAYHIFGMDPLRKNATYKAFLKIIHSDDVNMVLQHINDCINHGRTSNVDFKVKLETNEIKFINGRITPVVDDNGNVYRLLGTIQDITDRKVIEKQIVKAKEVAEAAVYVRERFMANISHEIRTPMNGILGLTNILLDMEKNEEKYGYLKAIKSSADNLLVIINDLLDFSKIESGRMTFESISFDLKDLLRSMSAILEIKAKEKNVSLEVDLDNKIPDFVMGDTVRLNQIVVNLVGNAIKFTDKGSVKIAVKLLEEQEEEIRLQFDVIDTGIGISEDKLGFIFESFAQANIDTERKFGGTGLGLAICKQLCELQNGRIWVESEEGKGSVFSFILPFGKSKEKKEKREVVPQVVKKEVKVEDELDWSTCQILLVEDNKVNQMLAKKVLTSWGLQVDIANNGLEALDLVKENPNYKLILMDLQMPKMDGYNATKALREDFNLSQPIIAMTASAMQEELDKCLHLGMNDYITKPFQPADLKELIGKWLNNN
jgi:PAS domain S-box-containing protein